MKTINRIIFLLLLFAFFACEEKEDDKTCGKCCDFSNTSDTVVSLVNTWIFLGYLNESDHSEECKPEDLREMNIEFSDTNRFKLQSSCNTGAGYYSILLPDSIITDSMISTEMYCLDSNVREWEENYFSRLQNACTYSMDGEILTIKTTGNISLVFRIDK